MAANGIPLHCNICPKKPTFSDVSHLLTHIASKGHLSNYYKVKVRSGTEDACRRLIESYDRWYAQWNVEELMSDRMNQKDKRRTRARPAARANPPPRIQAPAPRSARPRVAVSNLLDPRLSEQQMIKLENSITPTPTPQPGPAFRHQPFAPRMQYWPAGSRSTSQSYTNPDYDTSSEYSDPSERKRYRYTLEEDSCAIEDDPVDSTTASTEDPMAPSECTKLKGVYWPGMDLFDSATPEMRRKRNQKKDVSVVEQLELNSLAVEATEIIFSPRGSFKKQRRISDSEFDDEEEEDSTIKSESPRPYLARPALTNMDVNTRRLRQSVRPSTLSYVDRGHYDSGFSRPNLGYNTNIPRKKAQLSVFQDESETFIPTSFNYLTAAYHSQATPSPVPAFHGFKSSYHEPFGHENKENVMPAYHQAAYEHQHQPVTYPFHAYAYGLGHDQQIFHYHHPHALFTPNAYQQHNEDNDDNRTLTAPPSPSTG
ncbi:hypothetical protein BDV96DRAFT_503620 [Lophiotrema nucula]|uniref:Uncharacterized protein n=1 Tax=Lophiotrema nucula TaxID=690887 RepID=A0A6A5YPT6_9PLEO|nr:hypothetical protein BDV96DRAFT_503620 [Lophiotrema nucula]